ncbi:hypothetical protein VNO78_03462 [Psophocarpus tetragonolobus]|uniref:VOC domain-containing protein n=1 Tax=Psophocarpus tetragonolobus TaxID=3891 RepID=A0AAN9TDA2_PSOTE
MARQGGQCKWDIGVAISINNCPTAQGLFNYGIGIHVLESEKVEVEKREINPKENHISFQCSDMKHIMQKLEGIKIEYVTAVVKEGGIEVDQVFFHDPDGYVIEICNCQNLPVLPISSCPLKLKQRSHTEDQLLSRRSHADDGKFGDRYVEDFYLRWQPDCST